MPTRNMIDESIWGEAVMRADVAAFLSGELGPVLVNEAVVELTGYSLEEIFANQVPPLHADTETEQIGEAVRLGRRSSGTGRIRRKDGRVISVGFYVARTRVAHDEYTFGLMWEEAA